MQQWLGATEILAIASVHDNSHNLSPLITSWLLCCIVQVQYVSNMQPVLEAPHDTEKVDPTKWLCVASIVGRPSTFSSSPMGRLSTTASWLIKPQSKLWIFF